jgi:Flp pilus assembly pilin Flp
MINRSVFLNIITLIANDEGATLVEYGIMLVSIMIACALAIGLVGGEANSLFSTVHF